MDKAKATEPTFSVEHLAGSTKYADNRDLLFALLEKDQLYTQKKADEKINNYLRKEVK